MRVAVGEDETFEIANVREEIHVLDIKCVDQEVLEIMKEILLKLEAKQLLPSDLEQRYTFLLEKTKIILLKFNSITENNAEYSREEQISYIL